MTGARLNADDYRNESTDNDSFDEESNQGGDEDLGLGLGLGHGLGLDLAEMPRTPDGEEDGGVDDLLDSSRREKLLFWTHTRKQSSGQMEDDTTIN
mmetsp:Transcript_24985/g.31198  ORF Transcript_24985/g.31198 Transcript_24985/m.31198 type:complete len:96 (+) Transcript_24985:1747-2034(+)|eukprot:CAMPEP_0170453134 /NCGR_PEP_ID=MMETSP0123-20130129/1810_1 /TAXON_ID=182087 /ORGANISM="Favella ehrenbergii, Strain Fehren 1" /LENGTH=95 /DNA_ID=CAMNT_0010715391 /DNA_START=1673 /DNA_END=1960 /DNA_ORIENTATION=-